MTNGRLRSRMLYAASAGVVLIIGMAWRSPRLHLPPFLAKYGADALWSALVYLGLRFLAPQAITRVTALVAFAFSVVVEFSQLYHAPWIDQIRATRLGALVLGSVFNWPDLPAYAVGVLVAFGLDYAFRRGKRV